MREGGTKGEREGGREEGMKVGWRGEGGRWGERGEGSVGRKGGGYEGGMEG